MPIHEKEALFKAISALAEAYKEEVSATSLEDAYNGLMLKCQSEVSELGGIISESNDLSKFIRRAYSQLDGSRSYMEIDNFTNMIAGKVIEGNSPADIYSGVRDFSSQSKYKGNRIYAVLGFDFKGSVAYQSGHGVIEPSKLYHADVKRYFFGIDRDGRRFHDDSFDFGIRRPRPTHAVIVPFLFDKQFTLHDDNLSQSDLSVEDDFTKIQAAIMLSGGYCLQPLRSIDVIDHPYAPEMGVSVGFHTTRYYVNSEFETGGEIIASILESFMERVFSISAWGGLRVPFSRLHRSRVSLSRVDTALDQGICIESIFTHGDTMKTETTYRIKTRAARFLGSSPEDRAAMFNSVGRLYDARSDAAHKGYLDKSDKKYDPREADDICVKALSKIIEAGAFPSWLEYDLNSLV